MNIIPVIRDLLLRNQKALIPGFGAFVLSQKPAQLNRVTGVLTPPAVVVRFDRTQLSDDGQLSGYLTRKLGLDKASALTAVNDFRKDTEEKLNEGQPVNIEGFGTLSKKPSGEIAFECEEELLKRISLFELPRIEVPKPVHTKVESVQPEVRKESPVSVKVPVEVKKETEYHRNRKWIIPIVLLGLLIGMLVVIYFTGNMGMLVSDMKSIFVKEDADSTRQLVFGNPVADTLTIRDTLTSEISRELDNQVDRAKALSINKQEEKEGNDGNTVIEQPVHPVKTNYAKAYHIVAGSFTVLENAEKQRSTLKEKGLNAEILPKKGKFYMVSLGSFNTPAEAASERDKIQKAAGFELWVMKNK